MNKPKLSSRIVITILVVAIWLVCSVLFNMAKGPIESRIAVGQLNDSVVGYTWSRAVAEGLIVKLIHVAALIILAGIWIPYGVRYSRYIRSIGQ